MNTPTPNTRAFTLVELLVVISIIVILLALLVPALTKALQASENTKCTANQANIVASLTLYCRENKDKYPTNLGIRATEAQDGQYTPATELRHIEKTRGELTAWRNQQDTAAITGREPLGIGRLVGKYLPETKLGEVIHCPRLDTSSAVALPNRTVVQKYGMDAVGSTNETAGGSWWVRTDESTPDYRIAMSYNYRALSRQLTGGGPMTFINAKSDYIFTADFPDKQYGRAFAHQDGYIRAFGDGHAGYFSDPPDSTGNSQVEKIPVDTTHKFYAGNGQTIINGINNALADEAIYKYMSVDKR